MGISTTNDASELRRFRLLTLLGATLYPGWQFIYRAITDDAYDPMWQRLAVSALFVLSGLLSFVVPTRHERREQVLNALVAIMTCQFVYLVFMNQFRTEYLLGLVIVIESSHLVVSSIRGFFFFQFFALGATGCALAFGGGATFSNKVVFFCGIVTLAIVNFVSHLQRAIFLQRAHDHALFIAEQQNKMAALGDATAGLAHEIRNILAIAIGYTNILAAGVAAPTSDPVRMTATTEKMQKALTRILKIVQSLQSFAHQSSDSVAAVTPLAPLVDEAIEVVSTKAKRWDVRINNQIAPTIAAYCHNSQFGQVLVNLLTNSIDAINGLPDRWITVTAEHDASAIVVRVIDSGNGIPAGTRDKIMEPYFTTKPRGVGTGLGLSISRSLIESQGGSLSIDAEAPHTCFVVRLRTGAAESAQAAA